MGKRPEEMEDMVSELQLEGKDCDHRIKENGKSKLAGDKGTKKAEKQEEMVCGGK